MSRSTSSLRSNSKPSKLLLNTTSPNQHQQGFQHKTRGLKLRPKPRNESPFEFIFVPEMYGLPSTYEYPYATKNESHPELASPVMLRPKDYQPPQPDTTIATIAATIDSNNINSSIAGQPLSPNSNELNDTVVGLDSNDEQLPKLTQTLSRGSSAHSTASSIPFKATSSQHTSNTATSSNKLNNESTHSDKNSTTATTNPTSTSNTTAITTGTIPSSTTTPSATIATTPTPTIKEQPILKDEKPKKQETPIGKMITTYSTLKEKLLSFRSEESRLLQQAGSHNSVTQSEERKSIALSTIVHRVRQTRKLLLSRISSPRWEVPHHYHTTALEHSLGRKQPNVMEVGELIHGHLRIYAIARRTTLSQKILIYALNRAKKAKQHNQDRIKAITTRLKEIRTRIKELEELIVQVRQKGIELLNVIAQLHYSAVSNIGDNNSTEQSSNTTIPKALILNNGQITTNLINFVNNIPSLSDSTKQELLKMVTLFNIDILSSQSTSAGAANRDIRSSFLKQLHIAPVVNSSDSDIQSDLQLSQEDKELVHDLLRSVRDEMSTTTPVSTNPNHEQPIQFHKDVVVGEAMLFAPTSTPSSTASATTAQSTTTQISGSPPTTTELTLSTTPPSDDKIILHATSPTSPQTISAQTTTSSISMPAPHGGEPDTPLNPLSTSTGSSPTKGSPPSSQENSPPTSTAPVHRFTTVDVLPQPSLHFDTEDDYETRILTTGATSDREASLLSRKLKQQQLQQQEQDQQLQDDNNGNKDNNASNTPSDGSNINNQQNNTQSTTQEHSILPQSNETTTSKQDTTSTSSTAATSSQNQNTIDTKQSLLSPPTTPQPSSAVSPSSLQSSNPNSPLPNQQSGDKQSQDKQNDGSDGDLGSLTRTVSDLMSLSFDLSKIHEELKNTAVLQRQQQQEQQQQQLQQINETQDTSSQGSSSQHSQQFQQQNNHGNNLSSTSSQQSSSSQQQSNQQPLSSTQLLSQQQQQPPFKRSSSQPRYKAHAPTSMYHFSSATSPTTPSTTNTTTAHQPPSSSSISTTTTTIVGSSPTQSSLPHHLYQEQHYPSSLPITSAIPTSHTTNPNEQQSPPTPITPQPLKVHANSTLGSKDPNQISVFGGGFGSMQRKTILSNPTTTTTTSSSSLQHQPTGTTPITSPTSTTPTTPNTSKLGVSTKPAIVRYPLGGSKLLTNSSATTTITSSSPQQNQQQNSNQQNQ